MTRIYAYFALAGEFDPAEATRVLRLQPTKTWRRGEPLTSATALTHKSNGWELGTQEEEGLDLPRHVEKVLSRLHPLSREIEDLRRRFGLKAWLQCVAYVTRQTPITSLSRETLRKLVDLGASLDFDMILVGSQQRGAS